jgi:hypothetical protein
MIWSKGLTAEQATLYVMGFNYRLSLDQIYDVKENELRNCQSFDDAYKAQVKKVYNDIEESSLIYLGLLTEVRKIAGGSPNILEFYLMKTPLENSLITVDSLAEWFYEMGDLEKAKKLIPNFTPKIQENALSINELKEQNNRLCEENERLKVKLESLENKLEPMAKLANKEIRNTNQKTRINSNDYLKALGAMAIIADQATNGTVFRHGGTLSANKYKTKIESLGLEGISNINKDITAAFEDPEIRALLIKLKK